MNKLASRLKAAFAAAFLLAGGLSASAQTFNYVLPPGIDPSGAIDSTSAINSALQAGPLFLPTGTYKISGPIACQSGKVCHLRGAGPLLTIILQTGTAADGIDFLNSSLLTGGSIRDLAIMAGTAAFQTGGASSGIGISYKNLNDGFIIDNVWISNFATGISEDSSFNTSVSNFWILYSQTAGISIPTHSGAAVGAGNRFRSGLISNTGFTGPNGSSIGLSIKESGGDYYDFLDITSYNNGVVVQPAAAHFVTYQFFTNVLADTSTSDNWTIDATNGNITSIQCVDCWGAFSTNGSGLVTKSTGSNLDSLRWIGGRLRENGQHGWSHQGGVNAALVGAEVAHNSKLTNNTYDGVNVAANVNAFSIVGNRIGNFASTQSNLQRNGITIAAGTSQQFQVIGNDLTSNSSAAFSNGSSTSNLVAQGNFPLQTSGLNISGTQSLTGGSGSTVAAGATVYLGPAGSFASNTAAPFVANKIGVVTGFYAAVNAAPGAAQTFTYTVYQNGNPTSMTGTISGASSTSVFVTTNAFTVNAQDSLVLQLVTSGGAAVTLHRFYMSFEP